MWHWWVVLAGLGVLALLSELATYALTVFSRGKLESICQKRNKPSRLGAILQGYERTALATETLATLGSALLLSAALMVTTDGLRTTGIRPLIWGVALGIGLLVVVRVWVPHTLGQLWAERFLYTTWPVLQACRVLAAPLTGLFSFYRTIVYRLAGRPETEEPPNPIEEELRTVVSEGEREGVLEGDAREMIEGVIEFKDADVAEVMTPRTDMVSLPATADLAEVCQTVLKAGHSRIPVIGKNRDDILGILYVKDLIARIGKDGPEPFSLLKIVHKPYFVPETKKIHALLNEFRRERSHIAIVLDEYGGTAGLVTLEDILEEIVGEIADEYDEAEEEPLKVLSDSVAEVDARVHIDELNERMGLDLPEDDDFETLGGFAFSELGHIPEVGDRFTHNNVMFTILDVDQRKINRLRVEVGPSEGTQTS